MNTVSFPIQRRLEARVASAQRRWEDIEFDGDHPDAEEILETCELAEAALASLPEVQAKRNIFYAKCHLRQWEEANSWRAARGIRPIIDAARLEESDLSFVRDGKWFEHPLVTGETPQEQAAAYSVELCLIKRVIGQNAANELYQRIFDTMPATENGCWDTECGYWFVQIVAPTFRGF
ncbi:MAG: hypothetical protein WCO00_08885 [Rhodospirillaceae bacterium]